VLKRIHENVSNFYDMTRFQLKDNDMMVTLLRVFCFE